MAIRTSPKKTESLGTAVIEQLAALELRSIPPETARTLLRFRFDDSHDERVKMLSGKARAGTLTSAEADALDEYIRVGTLVSTLQSKARQVLKNAGQTL